MEPISSTRKTEEEQNQQYDQTSNSLPLTSTSTSPWVTRRDDAMGDSRGFYFNSRRRNVNKHSNLTHQALGGSSSTLPSRNIQDLDLSKVVRLPRRLHPSRDSASAASTSSHSIKLSVPLPRVDYYLLSPHPTLGGDAVQTHLADHRLRYNRFRYINFAHLIDYSRDSGARQRLRP